MNVLLIGDVIGKPGRKALQKRLRELREQHDVSFVTANAENIAGGAGVTRETAEELFVAGVDCLTSGNHVWDKKEVIPYINEKKSLLRPANYPEPAPGTGVYLTATDEGVRLAVINLMGRVYMANLDCPFRKADQILREIQGRADVILVDMHAEVTSEKGAMGWYLDGRVSVVYGTHTHIPTADERVLPGGTAFQTDVGMTGSYDSVIGCDRRTVIERFLSQRHIRLTVADENVWIRATLVEVDGSNGRARSIRRIALRDSA